EVTIQKLAEPKAKAATASKLRGRETYKGEDWLRLEIADEFGGTIAYGMFDEFGYNE
ncbi:unnamed protein product, partial [Effrenium voratum]